MTAIAAIAVGFYPTNSVIIAIADRSVSNTGIGSSRTAAFTIDNDGTTKNHNLATLETWLAGVGGIASNYEVRATLTAGALSSGTTGSWLNCGSDRFWSVTDSGADDGPTTASFTIEVRDAAAPNTVRDSASITLSANLLGGS